MTQYSPLFLCCALFLASQLCAPRFPEQFRWPQRRGVAISYSSDSSIDTDSEEESFSPTTLFVKQRNAYKSRKELLKRHLISLERMRILSLKWDIKRPIKMEKKHLLSYRKQLRKAKNEVLNMAFQTRLHTYFAAKNSDESNQALIKLKNLLVFLEKEGLISLKKEKIKTLLLNEDLLNAYETELTRKCSEETTRHFQERRQAYYDADGPYQDLLNAYLAWPFESLQAKFSDEVKYPGI